MGAADRTKEIPTCSIPRLQTEYTCIKSYSGTRQIMTLTCLKSDADVTEIQACRNAQLEVFQRCLLPQEGTRLHWPTQMLLPAVLV